MLISFLRARICDEEINEAAYENLTEENLEKLYSLAKSHDVAQIVADVLFEQKLICEGKTAEKYKFSLMMAIIHYQRLSNELKRICALFDENGICHMPLKGSVLRAFYPEPWLRTSCDADILVKPLDLERAANLLTENFNYTISNKGSHDWSFYSPGKVCIELHFDLIEQGKLTKNQFRHKWNAECLSDVWSDSALCDNTKYKYQMPNEMFYFYHVAHMAKHFENGGCGIRSFLDLWILNKKYEYDREKVEKMLSESGLLKFERTSQNLSEVWLGCAEYDETAKQVESYILNGGVYGTAENKMAVQQNKNGSRFKYVMTRLFLPYEYLKIQYPVLNKHKWLLPVCEIRRWFRMLLFGRLKNSVDEYKLSQEISDEKIKNVTELLESLGL